ncbi:hypothetical protein V6N11_008749 [Hibiscus sabdariffa]|uniref:Uncharacterized protein n=1 Tax=Hibiscus sabdariffa TaxID=183260 RepID=A0ABR2NQU2_9ROSI
MDGDRNTKFYHASVKVRHRANTIIALQGDEGVCVTDQEEMSCMAPALQGDLPVWAADRSGRFSVKSAYWVWNRVEEGPEEDVWSLIARMFDADGVDDSQYCNVLEPGWYEQWKVLLPYVRRTRRA